MKKDEMKTPYHIGIILDGNRRWAKKNSFSTLKGHKRGLDNLKKIVKHAYKRKVKIITVYAFSTENWNRDEKEVSYLLKLFNSFIKNEVNKLSKEGVKIKFFGRLNDFNLNLQKKIKEAELKTKKNNKGQLNICLSYGGRDEIIRAIKKIIKKEIKETEVTEKLICQNLDSCGLKDPDLIIRTSGEQRLSGFLTWQGVYSELYFSKKYWPEFNENDFDLALEEYSKRKRRFGAN